MENRRDSELDSSQIVCLLFADLRGMPVVEYLTFVILCNKVELDEQNEHMKQALT